MSIVNPTNFKVIENLLSDFMPFALERMGIEESPQIRFAKDPDNARNPLGKTGYYEPETKMITVYIDGRHPKDIMRSVSHELVHHAQNLRGDLAGTQGVGEQGYAQNNDHLREMEREAYEQGNLCFRDWEDGIKSENPTMYESLRKKNKSKNLQEVEYPPKGEFHTGVPDEDWQSALDTEKYPIQAGELETDRIAAHLERAWVESGNDKKNLAYVDGEILDLAMAVVDGKLSFIDAVAEVQLLERKLKESQFAATASEEAQKINAEAGIHLNTEQEYWERVGVRTGEELAIEILTGTYSDMFKSIHNIRPRRSFSSVEEVQAAIERLDGEMEAAIEQQKLDAQAEEEYRKNQELIASLMPNEMDVEYEKMPKRSGMGRGAMQEELNMFERRNIKLNQRLMESFGYKVPVTEGVGTMVYQPILSDEEWETGDLRTYEVFASEEEAQTRFPNHEIQQLSSDDIEDAYWADTGEPVEQGAALEEAYVGKGEIPVHSGQVASVGFKRGRYFWRHTNGLTNSYDDESRFFMSLRDAGVGMSEANELLLQVRQKVRQKAGGIQDGHDGEMNPEDDYNWVGHRAHYQEAKRPVLKEASDAIEAFADAFWNNAENMPYGSEESDGALVLDYRGAVGAVIYEDEQGAYIDIDGLSGQIRDPIEAAKAIDQMIDGGKKTHSTNAGDPSKSEPLYQEGKYRSGEDTIYPDQHNHNLDMAQDSWEAANAQAREDLRNGTVDQEKLKYDEEYREAIEAQKGMMQEGGSMAEYGRIDAEDGNPPSKIGQGNSEYMKAYNSVLIARGEEPLPIAEPDQAYVDALHSGRLEEARPNFMGSDEEKEMMSKMSAKDHYKYVTQDRGRREMSPDEINAIESFNNWRKANPVREQDWEPAQVYRNGRILAYHIKDSSTIDPVTGRAKIIQKHYDVSTDMYVDDEDLNAILPEAKLKVALKARLTEVFAKYPQLASNKDFINTIKEGVKSKIMEKQNMKKFNKDFGTLVAEGVVDKLKERWGEDEFGSMFDSYDDDEDEMGLEPSPEEEEIEALLKQYGLSKDAGPAADAEAGAAAMADMEDDADLGRRPEDDEEDLGEQSMYGGCDPREDPDCDFGGDKIKREQSMYGGCDPREDPDCDFGGDKIKRRRPEDEKKKATVMREDDGEYAHLGIKTTQDQYGPLHVLPNVQFTGDIAADIKQIQQNDELDSWLWGELGSDESITDAAGKIVYSGADVQDHVGAEADHDGSYQPRMAEGAGGMSVEQFADAFDLSPSSDQNGQVVFYAVDDGGIKAQEIHTQAQRSGFDVESDNDGQMVIYTHEYPRGQTDMDETHDHGWSDKRNTRLNEALMNWAIK